MQFKQLERLYASGRISRREFLRAAMAIGAVGAASGMLSSAALAAGPRSGGHFKVGLAHGSTTDSLDPTNWENDFTSMLGYTFNNYLTEVDKQGNLVGELAESWEGSDGAKKWVFKLRKGVTFHNGKTVTPQDVIDSMTMHRGEDSKSPAKPLLAPVTEIRADGDHVVFLMETGNADFPYLLSDYHIPIMPSNGNGDVDRTAGIGAGGYIVKEFEPGVRAVLERNPDYWKTDRAHFDSAEILSVIDVAARTNALTTSEVHAIDRCDLKTVHLLKRDPSLNVTQVTGFRHYTFPMRTDIAPFDNPDVRMALKLALNREELVQKILRGYGIPGNDTPIAPATSFYADLEQRTYDPERARALLKKAGMEGLTVDLSAADAAFPGAVDAAVLYKEHAAAAGIDINVVREPNDGYWSSVWMNKPWCACYWSGRPTADWMFSTAYAAGADWNDTFWDNERFNELLTDARVELDPARRAEMYAEMQRIVRDDGGTVVGMFSDYVSAHSNEVSYEPPIAANWPNDGQRMIERWWFTG